MSRLPPILAFAAPSGTGKTTLVEGVVRALVADGLRVGVLKSDAHRVVLDTPGKDSWRFSQAGAAQVVVLSAARLAMFAEVEGEVSLVHLIDRLFPGADLVLCEGFRRSGLPSLRVHRQGGPSTDDWAPPGNCVGWVTDAPEAAPPGVVLPLGAPERVAEWIRSELVRPSAPRRATVVLPVVQAEALAAAVADAARLERALGAPALLVVPTLLRASVPAGVAAVTDLRPGLGLLGALFTGLASVDTPEVLLVGARHRGVEPQRLSALLDAPRRADVVVSVLGGADDPSLALYGHRCLSHIQSALLGGELRLTGWWGQVRVHRVGA